MARTSKRTTKRKSNDKSVVIGKNQHQRKTRVKTEPISRSSDGSEVVSTQSTPSMKTPSVGSKPKGRKTRVKTEPKSSSTDEFGYGSSMASKSKTPSVKTLSVASTPRGRPRKSNKLKVDSKIFSQKYWFKTSFY